MRDRVGGGAALERGRGVTLAFITWRSGRATPLVGLLILALLIGVTTLYLRQTARLRWRWKLALLGLRVCPLMALALALLEPTLVRDARPDERGAVVVLVDHSHSMALHDRQRGPGQLVALADGLGLLPPQLRASGDEWLAAAAELTNRLVDVSDAQSRLTFARISGLDAGDAEAQVAAALQRFDIAARALQDRRGRPEPDAALAAALAKLVAAAAKPQGAEIGEAWLPDVQSAVENVAKAAGNYQFGADQRLYARDARVKATCDELAEKSRLQVVEEAVAHPATGLLYHLPAGVRAFGFAVGDDVAPLPLRGTGGAPIRRLLLDTDASGTNLARAVREAVDGLRGAAVRAVVLFSDGREPSPTSAVAPAAGGAPVFAVCAAPLPGPREPAVKDLSVALRPLPATAYPGETFTLRGLVNATGFAPGTTQPVRCEFDASQSNAVVTLPRNGAADVSFNVRFDAPGLRHVALRLPDVRGEVNAENNLAEAWIKVLPRSTRVTLLADEPTRGWRCARDTLASAPGFDVKSAAGPTSAPASGGDALVLVNARPDSFDDAGWQRVTRFVRDDGGLLVLAADDERQVTDFARSPAAALLPFSLPHASSGASEWRVWRGDEAAIHFEPPATSPADRLAWAAVPPAYRYLPLPPLKQGSEVLLVELATKAPVVARLRVGRGTVVFVGISETWRWRYRAGSVGDRFWPDLLRQNVEPPYAATDDVLSLDVERPVLGPHDAVRVRAKISSGGPPSLEVRVLRDGQEVRKLTVPRGADDRYSTALAPLPLGHYTVEASTAVDGKARVVSYPLHVVGSYGGDAENPAAGRDALRRIAEASGGRLLAMEQLAQLPALIAATPEVRTVPVRLWDSSYLFAFVVACFTAEWALRKRMGLA